MIDLNKNKNINWNNYIKKKIIIIRPQKIKLIANLFKIIYIKKESYIV